jgi:tetratricopeptide (TPR) repeat protein
LVTRGLGDLIEKCLARDPSARYADAASLADDLRHELADLPLRGVPNRSLTERWRKWRRRKPQALRRLTASAIVVALGGGAPLVYLGRQARDAQLDLQAAEQLLDRGKFPAAVDRLRTGLGRLAFVPGHADLKSGLQGRLSWAQQRRWAEDLHKLVDQLRFHDSGLRRLPAGVQGIDRSCRTIWQARDKILAEFTASDGGAAEQESRTDLIDLAILWAGLKVRSAAPSEADQARRGALELLDQAEQTFGRSLVLDQERTAYAAATDESPRPAPARNAAAPRSAWEHEALGRFFLHRGRLDDAEQEFRQALQTAPKSFWPNYYTGICAFQADDRPAALTAFSVCVALNPESAECFFNRGMTLAALDRPDDALDDYSRALEIDPRLAAASLYRGMLHRDAEDFEQAANDFEQALKNGAEPSAVHYQWALLHLARHDREAAKASLRAALSHSPQDREARELLKTLE